MIPARYASLRMIDHRILVRRFSLLVDPAYRGDRDSSKLRRKLGEGAVSFGRKRYEARSALPSDELSQSDRSEIQLGNRSVHDDEGSLQLNDCKFSTSSIKTADVFHAKNMCSRGRILGEEDVQCHRH
jgi:hypothetical protein